MTNERYYQLNDINYNPGNLTKEELKEGWHFCVEWDGLLIGPGMGELAPCTCRHKGHPMYKTIPKDENR